jgi:thiol-disulfide isomerase/thioredoxin
MKSSFGQKALRSRFKVLAMCIVVFLMMTGFAFSSQEKIALGSIGGEVASNVKPATDFELRDLSGTTIKLSQFKGDRPVLLYFWATWCPYCLAAKPKIAQIREEIPRGEMEILGINVGGGDTLERVKKYQEGHPMAWPILFDGDSKVSSSYRVQGIPMYFLVNKEGNVIYSGNNLPPDLKQLLQTK